MGYARGMLLSDIPENREVAGDAACYYKCSDSNSLYESLNAILEDRGLLAELGKRGRARVENDFNWDRIADSVEQFYAGIMGG
jgi:glycosyltransferase involved in cell wall biosynthesis